MQRYNLTTLNAHIQHIHTHTQICLFNHCLGRLLRRRYHLQDITINQRIAPRGARVFLEQMFDRLPISGSVKRSTLRLLDGTAVNIIILVITAEQAVLIELERSSIYGLPYWIASQQHEERRDDYGTMGIQILRSDRGVTNGPNSPTEWDNHSQGSRSGSAGKGSAVGSGAGKGGTRSL